MLVLGLAGGLGRIGDEAFDVQERGWSHDAAAALVEDGTVVAAVEQERLDRIKHSNRMPFEAIRAVLEMRGVGLADVDRIAFYLSEEFMNFALWGMYVEKGVHGRDRSFLKAYEAVEASVGPLDIRKYLRARLQEEFGVDVGARLSFVEHHLAHAASAISMSGFDECLAVVIDAEGDNDAGLVLDVRGSEYERLATIPIRDSLGHFYMETIAALGYTLFDEYKVMGLAPYGDPATFRWFFDLALELQPEGQFRIARERLRTIYGVVPPRRSTEPITQVHMDLAASLQEALEKLVFHFVSHHAARTKQRRLCLAGGVAHNCTLNGKLLRSGLFDDVFVQPAAHDAGCAVGAALLTARGEQAEKRPRLEHVYWGKHIGSADQVERVLRRWEDLVEIEVCGQIEERAARLIADDAVLGWVQGRSEFGPRALGNRSIVADPRLAANKDRINAMVKKREAYRPFAPSVIEERASEFFEVPGATRTLPFMTFVVGVKEEKRSSLAAITHVDGTARIQTVSRKTNEPFWKLIHAFGEITGVPVLLNTSFNNNVEPIVDSVDDAVVCFLTTGLNYLAVDRFLLRKKDVADAAFLNLVPTLPRFVSLHREWRPTLRGRETVTTLRTLHRGRVEPISEPVERVLAACDGKRTLGEVTPEDRRSDVVREVRGLWAARLVELTPMRSV